jgi:hypothetical protein
LYSVIVNQVWQYMCLFNSQMCSVFGSKLCFGFQFSIFVGVTGVMCISAYLFLCSWNVWATGQNWILEFHISVLCNCLAVSVPADVFHHIMHFPYSTWFCFCLNSVWPSIVKNFSHIILHSGTPSHLGASRPICRAICRNGQQCRNSASLGSDVCRRHNSESSFHWYYKRQKLLLYSRELYFVVSFCDACFAILW